MTPLLVLKPNGKSPYSEWVNKISDEAYSLAIYTHVENYAMNLGGTVKPLGEGLLELKIHKGGLRVYFTQTHDGQMYILGGGDKKTQQLDIENAKKLWQSSKPSKLSSSTKNPKAN